MLTLAACLLCVACSKQADAPAAGTQAPAAEAAQTAAKVVADAGEKSALTHSADGVTYINDYLGLQISKPEGWYAQPPEETLKMTQQGMNVMAGDDKSMKAMLAASLKSSLPVFGFFDAPPGTPGKNVISLVGMAENIGALPGIKSGCDYLSHVRQMLAQSAPQYSVREGCGKQTVNGAPLGVLVATTRVGNFTITQNYMACVKGEHAIGLVGSSFDAAGAAKIDAALQTLKLQCQ